MRFNTQPPEGGWFKNNGRMGVTRRFNTQPPEGGWIHSRHCATHDGGVSTHSRPKAAGRIGAVVMVGFGVSTHSRPKAAGAKPGQRLSGGLGFNTQPPEGGWCYQLPHCIPLVSFNTQPPEGGWSAIPDPDAE